MVIDPKRLLELRRIAEHGSFSRAAEALGISQPALSKSVSILERSLGVRIAERTRQGSKLTSIGELLLSHAEGLEILLQRAAEQVEQRKKGVSGSLVIGVSPVASAWLVPQALAQLKVQTPDISATILEDADDELLRQLRTGRIDVVVSPAGMARDPAEVRSEILTRDRIEVVVRRKHAMSKRRAISLRDLRDAKWVLPSDHTAMYRHIEALFAAESEPWPNAIVSTNSITSLKSLIMRSDYVSISSTVLMQPEIEAGYIVPVSLRAGHTTRDITVRTRSQPPVSPLVERFIAHLRAAARPPRT